MFLIQSIVAREILDSRGNPTVQVDVCLANGVLGRASVPSGASTGKREACELRDNDQKRYAGKGVLKAIKHIHTEIQPMLKNKDAREQALLDGLMIKLDGTPNKSRLGANALLGVSLAMAKACAIAEKKPLYQYLHNLNINNVNTNFNLPVPMMNIINGGMHADNNLDIQEFMILPVGASYFSEALRQGAEVFHSLKSLLAQKKFNTNVGDEGGFAPNLRSHDQALTFILEAIHQAGFVAGKDIYLGLDIASSAFYQNKAYYLSSENKILDSQAFLAYLENLVNQYPIISIEDGMAEDDCHGWELLTEKLGHKIQLVGDDIFVTNTSILLEGIQQNIANAVLIKPNQIGTLTETLQVMNVAKEANYGVIVSHRSGETEDSFIADLAVGFHANQIKTGSLCRSERVAKYNQLLRIQEYLNANDYTGKQAFSFL